MLRNLLFGLVTIMFISCTTNNDSKIYKLKNRIKLANTKSTLNTLNLFKKLKVISNDKIIFGHQHSLSYGIGWKDQKFRSDVKDVCGSLPGIIGWDFADFQSIGDSNYYKMIPLLVYADGNGMINSFSWHLKNLVSNKSFYDTTIAVVHLLPGGSHNKVYNKHLDKIANFSKHLVNKNGKVIPIIFRPFHEMDGSWFWWGKRFCSSENFKQLWRYTFNYLANYRNVKNILYAFSPDRNFYTEKDYLERYPGDEYVDILGMDNYYDFKPGGDGLELIRKKLILISEIAKKKNKIAAFTETGLERIPDENWWTEKLQYVIEDERINIAYALVWRNAGPNHFYAPYKGQKSCADFLKFKNNSKIIFADDLLNLF